MPPKIAAVTMVYNEGHYLPVWASHYSRQVGADYCYVIDHGSTETIVLPPGMNLVRLPRSPQDDRRRADFVSNLVESLLNYYDWVIYTDVDEMVIANPDRYSDLPSFCAEAMQDTVTCIGFDMQQVPALEPALQFDRPLGEQRHWARFTSAMCKPLLTRTPRHWSPGFHSADTPMTFSELYLFHLHWADHAIGLQRLGKTRAMSWDDAHSGAHQRGSDAAWVRTFDSMAALSQQHGVSFNPAQDPLATWLALTKASELAGRHGIYQLQLDINADTLWELPSRYRSAL